LNSFITVPENSEQILTSEYPLSHDLKDTDLKRDKILSHIDDSHRVVCTLEHILNPKPFQWRRCTAGGKGRALG
jgi:hypothetical protein